MACRVRAPQGQLVRFVRAGAGFSLDASPRGPGRGAYLCSSRCAARVAKHKRYPGLAEAAAQVAWDVLPGSCTGEVGVYDRQVPP